MISFKRIKLRVGFERFCVIFLLNSIEYPFFQKVEILVSHSVYTEIK